jgi:hypothetical protein
MSSPEPFDPTPQPNDPKHRANVRRRSIALALVLAAAVALFYVLTIVKMGAGMFNRAL